MRLGGRRDRVTVRIKRELKEALKQFCLANGLSICHISEALYTAYLLGVNQKINLDVKRPTIELTVVREVKRPRRYLRESGGGRDVVVEDLGSLEKCGFCGERSVAVHYEWVDRYRCVRQFTCRRHHERLKRQGTSWSELGQGA